MRVPRTHGLQEPNLWIDNNPATDEEAREEKREVSSEEDWSRRWDLNPRPADYESAALPLSYTGLSRTYERRRVRFYLMC